eukprot:10974596-Lingulodinium_polyedra.AAC.1
MRPLEEPGKIKDLIADIGQAGRVHPFWQDMVLKDMGATRKQYKPSDINLEHTSRLPTMGKEAQDL